MIDQRWCKALCRVGAGVVLVAGCSLIAAAPASGLAPTGGPRSSSATSGFDVEIDAAAAHHGVDRELVRAVIEAESGFDHRVVSTAGAQGLMQLMPATARRFGVTDPFDVRQNIFGGTRFLRVLLDAYEGDVSLSAAAYNAGEGAVARYGGVPPYRSTRAFVRRVQALLAARPQRAPGAVQPARVALGRLPALKPAPAWPLAFLARPWTARAPSGHAVERVQQAGSGAVRISAVLAGGDGMALATGRFGLVSAVE